VRRGGVERSGEVLRHSIIVGGSPLELDGLPGDVDLEWALDGVRSCLECSSDRSCAFRLDLGRPYDGEAWGGVGRTIPVPAVLLCHSLSMSTSLLTLV